MKIFTSILAILLVISLVIFGMVRALMLGIYEQRIDAELFNNANQLATQLSNDPQDQWDRLLREFQLENIAVVTITDSQGSYIFEGTRKIINSRSGVTVHERIEPKISLIFANNNQGFTLGVTSQASTLVQIDDIFTQIFIYVLIFIIVVAILTAFFYTRFLAKPIIEIAHVSKKMTNLDMLWHCKTNRTDEIGMLANNLNQMADQLKTTLEELHTANIKLQDDIQKEREHERRRRDFFAAVSHELKTPVTILKGELDGMILNVGKFKDRDKYLQEAYKTNESIEKLVREMMMLAKLDTIRLNLEQVSLSSILVEVAKQYEPLAGKKQLDIQLNSESDVFLQADRTQLLTVVSNVMSNAVKYSTFGQRVIIHLFKESEFGTLIVENVGVHIEEDEMTKLWEPFYRTEKSRNRDTGGSGLGLYLVKTILDLHRFPYKLENSEDGVRFTMNFPTTDSS